MKGLSLFLAAALVLWAQVTPALPSAPVPPVPERLTLAEAEELALRRNPQIEAARLRAQAAGQVPAQYGAATKPFVVGNLTGAGAPNDTRIAAGGINNPVIYSRVASGITLNQLLFDFGRNRALVASAQERARAEQDLAGGTRSQVLLSVRRAYYAALRAQTLQRVAEQTVAARQLVADQVKALTDAQLKSSLDQSFAEVAVSEARLLLSTAQNERRAADADLALALGYPEPRTFEVVEPLETANGTPSLDDLLPAALRQRPDLLAVRRELAAAQQFAVAERKNRLPSVSAIATFGYAPAHVSGLKNDVFAASGLNLTLPFLNGGLYRAREAEAELRARATERRVAELENQAVREVRVALLNLDNARERSALGQQLVERARQALDLAQTRYDLGLSSIVELTQAQLAVTQAQVQLANARFDVATQRAVLDYQAGVQP